MFAVPEKTASAATAESRVIDFLRQPRSYTEPTSDVTMIETHISCVFLTDRFVYKLKKPVVFDFLDFRTANARREACEQEVKLNRRLAPDIYLGVVPIAVDSRGRMRLEGPGDPIDWLVRMKRLPADRSLDRMIRDRTLTAHEIRQLSRVLAGFYQQLPPLTIRISEYRDSIERHVRANGIELRNPAHHLSDLQVRRVQSSQLRMLNLNGELFDNRVRDGRIVDGHGDLRPEHVYLAPTVKVIDCIEFNEDFRRIDVLDELSFLAMECELLGDEQVGQCVLDQYEDQSGDTTPESLRRFYQCYRACVRAKVCALRRDQTSGKMMHDMERAEQCYLSLADKYAALLGPPVVLVIRGLSGTGKSTLARSFQHLLGSELLQTDMLRRELFGPAPKTYSYGAGSYSPENRARVYEEMFRRARRALESRLSVILDGTFLSAQFRRQALELAEQFGASVLVVHCKCAESVAMERITGRLEEGTSVSEVQPHFLRLQEALVEPDPDGIPSCELDTNQSLPELQRQVISHLVTVPN